MTRGRAAEPSCERPGAGRGARRRRSPFPSGPSLSSLRTVLGRDPRSSRPAAPVPSDSRQRSRLPAPEPFGPVGRLPPTPGMLSWYWSTPEFPGGTSCAPAAAGRARASKAGDDYPAHPRTYGSRGGGLTAGVRIRAGGAYQSLPWRRLLRVHVPRAGRSAGLAGFPSSRSWRLPRAARPDPRQHGSALRPGPLSGARGRRLRRRRPQRGGGGHLVDRAARRPGRGSPGAPAGARGAGRPRPPARLRGLDRPRDLLVGEQRAKRGGGRPRPHLRWACWRSRSRPRIARRCGGPCARSARRSPWSASLPCSRASSPPGSQGPGRSLPAWRRGPARLPAQLLERPRRPDGAGHPAGARASPSSRAA